MARAKAAQISEFPFHITARTPNRIRFPVELGRVWQIFEEELYYSHIKYNFKILSFVLMPNHFHLMGITQEVPLGVILNDLMRDTSKSLNSVSGRMNQNWGETAYRCEIKNLAYFYNVYRYIYQNPLRAHLVTRCELYPYSTLSGLLGKHRLFIPTQEDTLLFDGDLNQTLVWLNTLQEKQDLEDIRHGLRYREFRLRKERHKSVQLLPDAPLAPK